MSSAPQPDPDALSADELKRLVARLLARVAALEEENRRLREGERPAGGPAEAAEAPARRHGPGDRAGRAGGSAPAAPDWPRRQAHAAGHRGARPHGGGAA